MSVDMTNSEILQAIVRQFTHDEILQKEASPLDILEAGGVHSEVFRDAYFALLQLVSQVDDAEAAREDEERVPLLDVSRDELTVEDCET